MMGIEEIKKWLQEHKYKKYGLKTEINPALTFFGIITFLHISVTSGHCFR